ncbi:MAG: hypothetical protein Q7R91_00445 [bacterium]|nr:hypothetical protein [bacterium]
MRINTGSNGVTVVTLESWKEIGIKFVLPSLPNLPPDDVGLALMKIPIEFAFAGTAAEEKFGLDTLCEIMFEPIYCPHGKPDSIDVTVSSDDPAVHFSFLVYPFNDDSEPGHEDAEG